MAIEKVRTFFKTYHLEDKIIEFDSSSATVLEAAERLNCDSKLIAKTLSFMVDNEPVLIVLAGDTKIDNTKYKEEFNTKAKMLSKEEVESLIGHAIGGVCPFAINDNVKVYLDESLRRFEYIYPAAGNDHSAIKLTINELEKYSNYDKWINVSKY